MQPAITVFVDRSNFLIPQTIGTAVARESLPGQPHDAALDDDPQISVQIFAHHSAAFRTARPEGESGIDKGMQLSTVEERYSVFRRQPHPSIRLLANVRNRLRSPAVGYFCSKHDRLASPGRQCCQQT